jgi:hypothetical protein
VTGAAYLPAPWQKRTRRAVGVLHSGGGQFSSNMRQHRVHSPKRAAYEHLISLRVIISRARNGETLQS